MGNPFSSPKQPDPPDYASAAEATAAGDLETARYQTLANRPDIYTPEGSRTWETDPNNPDRWIGTTTLNPEAQAAFEANQRMQTGLADLGEQSVNQVGDLFSTRFQTEGEVPVYQGAEGDLPSYGDTRQSVTDAMLSRVNTDISRDRDSVNSSLVARGIPVGSEAYNREMENIDRKQTDARQQAEIAAQQMAGLEYQSALAGRGMENQESMADYTTGLDTRRQDIQEALLNRQTPLNEISAFRTGSQVQQPQFQPYGNQTFTGGPDYLGAAGMQGQYDIAGYNADVAGQNALTSGLFGLGASGIGAYGAMNAPVAASDRRLKRNIDKVGELKSGLPVYEFNYIWSDQRSIGVMAQDVLKVIPEAVIIMSNGYMAVNYGMLR